MEGLTEGRNVHYVTSAGKHLAAIISEVEIPEAGRVTLHVLDPAGYVGYPIQQPISLAAPVSVLKHVSYSEKPEVFSWHWIERA